MRLRKKILGLLIAIVGLGCFSSSIGIPMTPSVHAQALTAKSVTVVSNADSSNTASTTPSASMEDNFRNLADIFLKVVYILLWPLVFLSGLALDNTMVYGAVFHMDAPLRQFWNLCKNFANFGLWFMILWSILQNIFTLWSSKKRPIDTIKSAAIAGILIQLSWFVVAAAIDVSTIATYAVGGIPMSILRTDNTLKNTKILQPNVNINFNNQNKISAKDFAVSYQVKSQNGQDLQFSSCRTMKWDTQVYIVWRQDWNAIFKNQWKLNYTDPATNKAVSVPDDVNACVYLGQVKFFHEFPDIAQLTGSAYDTKLNEILSYPDRNWREACGYILKVWTWTPTTETCAQQKFDNVQQQLSEVGQSDPNWKEPLRYTNRPTGTTTQLSTDAGKSRFASSAATSIGNIISQSKWFVGPLATIYGSMMDMANLSDVSTTNGTMGKSIGELIIRVAIAWGLLFPLLALTLVLITRIGFLRCIIGTSPIIILLEVFKVKIPSGGWKFDLGKRLSIGNIVKAIFAPVITVLALSMSLLFMTALMSTYKSNDPSLNQWLESMWVKTTIGTVWDANDSIDIFGLVLKYPKTMNTWAWDTGNWFSWMIICSAGIGIMRFILFAAIWASGTIGDIWSTIKKFGENMITTTPLPTPLGNVGLGTLKDNFTWSGLSDNMTKFRDNRVVDLKGQNTRAEAAVSEFMHEPTAEVTSKKETQVVEMIKSWKPDNVFETLLEKNPGTQIETASILTALDNNKNVEAAIDGLEVGKRDELLKKYNLTAEYTARKQTQVKEEFKKAIWSPKDEVELNKILNEKIKLDKVKLDKIKTIYWDESKFSEEVNVWEWDKKVTYTISIKDGKLISTEKKTK